MNIWEARAFDEADTAEWDDLVASSGNGTLLHTRLFLSYHGDRLADRSLCIRDAQGNLCGAFPAAGGTNAAEVISHPGATFGGLITRLGVTGHSYSEMMGAAIEAWSLLGYERLRYRPAPSIYHAVPCDEDRYELWRRGSRVTRRALSACIDIANRLPSSGRRRRTLAKAQRSDCVVAEGSALLPALWPVFEEALRLRHDVAPVHSLSEMEDLAGRFPQDIKVLSALSAGEPVAGAVLFCSRSVVHVQYSLASAQGAKLGAMDALIERGIEIATARGARFFDLGISTEHAGRDLNDGLHGFKMEFGAGTVVYEEEELQLLQTLEHS